ncbi:DUF4168 domain-containing protein [Marinobacter sp. R17]|uniref:DUF4168 domain-containing protein n=1 Tax=Marinobacter sp. R17 TaxID=2484250 RepID=UPI000F4CE5A0|nr:DUF4168 domain-containing protein [Marinobacter sp. R17]ROT95925.1 DUF4168 domain-containing protein [Marinobacter sp. R17]
MRALLTSATVSIALMAGASVTYAQNQPEQTSQQGYSNPAAAGTAQTNFSDKQLRKFAAAQGDLKDVRDQYMKKIESADSQEKAQKLQMEANDKMVTVIQDVGLKIPTYNEIATAYSSEPKVRSRVDALR